MATYQVYGLSSCSEGLRYVGYTAMGLAKRLEGHLGDAKRNEPQHVYNWIRNVLARGETISIYPLETCATVDEMVNAEIKHIAYWRARIGDKLTNMTPGGDGWRVGSRHSAETRLRMSVAKLGKKFSVNHREELSRAAKQRWGTTPDKEQKIKDLYSSGLNYTEIGRVVGLTRCGVKKILVRMGIVRHGTSSLRHEPTDHSGN